ncbi:Multidrug resistance-associated protein 1, partial [Linnemannia elongata]
MSSGYCGDQEGWGPTSPDRIDLTPCFESTVLSTLPACLAITAFSYRTWTLHRNGQAHGLGRTNLIYWLGQSFMLVSMIALVVRAALSGSEDLYSPATVLASTCMAVAWLFAMVLNRFEHLYEIRSSTAIYSYYLVSIVAGAITTRTLSALPSSSSTTLYYVYYGSIILGFAVEAWPRGKTHVQQDSKASPYEKANIFSRYWFHYIQHLISDGYKRPLQATDVQGMMPHRIKTKFSYLYLSDKWDAHLAKRAAKGKEPQLMKLLLEAYGPQWVPVLIYRFLASVLLFVAPELMNQLLSFTKSYSTDAPQPVALGIVLSFGMFFATLMSAMMEGQYNQLIMNMGIEARTALISMIYRKALKLSPAARQTQTPGEINNHMSVDAERWSQALPLTPFWLSVPLEICIALWLLYRQLGWAALAGLDNRIRLVNEVLSGIKIVKLYGWESSFRNKIAVYRNRELSILRKMGIAFSFMTIMFSSMTLLIALVSFSIYATVGGPGFTPGDINSQTIFVSITLFGMLNRPIGMLSYILGETIGLIVATRRIQVYLLSEELSDDQIERSDDLPKDPAQPVIEIKGGVFAWNKDGPEEETEKQMKIREKKDAKKRKLEDKEAKEAGLPVPIRAESVERNYEPTLKNITLSVDRSNLTAIVGRVGQGKTSLFNAMIGDMYKRHGTVRMSGRVAYAPQQTWIINATVKDNIVFGLPFDQDKYDRIVYAAGLGPDIEMLPAGDQTEIGE